MQCRKHGTELNADYICESCMEGKPGQPVVKLESIPPGSNPYLSDMFNMGTPMGKDILVMHKNHQNEDMEWMILVQRSTGKRLVINIKEFFELN